jgi:hypothetical protein
MPYVGSNPTPTMDAGQQGSGAAGQVADEGAGVSLADTRV